jgi:hypothetical protein
MALDPKYVKRMQAMDRVELLAYWIKEREAIRVKKERGTAWPWTKDPILGAYRFCSVHREDDKVTRWIAKNWRKPNASDPNLWHAMVVARFINWPDTLAAIGYPEPWNHKTRVITRSEMLRIQAEERKVFTGAYIVSTNGAPTDKITYVLGLFDRAAAADIPPWTTLADAHVALMQINGIGSFMAAQIIADLKNTIGHPLRTAPDWWNWAAPGPGSLRGLSRVRGLGTQSRWRKDAFIPELLELRDELRPHIALDLCLQDLQNCLCEADKFMRVLYGQGKPRSLYVPDRILT